MQNLLGISAVALAALSGLIVPAFPGIAPTPVALVGVGLPALVVLGGAYWLVRKLRSRGAPN